MADMSIKYNNAIDKFDIEIENGDIVIDDTERTQVYTRLLSYRFKFYSFLDKPVEWYGNRYALQKSKLNFLSQRLDEENIYQLQVLSEEALEDMGLSVKIIIVEDKAYVYVYGTEEYTIPISVIE